jgi:hypothetical protein
MFSYLFLGLVGCAARGTYDFLSAEQQYQSRLEQRVVSSDPNDLDGVYEWTLAEQFMQKAWEEYSNGEYEQSSKFAKLAIEWTELAKQAEQSSMEAQN